MNKVNKLKSCLAYLVFSVYVKLLFEGLEAKTDHEFKIRSVNKSGGSDWRTFSAKTKANSLEFSIVGIRAGTSVDNQGGNGILLKDKVYYSNDKDRWVEAGSFDWERRVK